MQGSGIHDPLAIEVCGLKQQAFIATAKDGSLAVRVDQDEGLGAYASGDGCDLGLYARAGEGFAMKPGGIVIAQLANIAGV
jgi:hypothetical protein